MIQFVLLMAVLAAHRGPAVTVTLSPSAIGMSGHPLCVQVTVPPHIDNRILSTVIDCENFFRSWQEQLDGADAIYSRRHCFDPMPQGQCIVGADLYRRDPKAKSGVKHFSDRKTVCFAGSDTEC